jgi:hypothetical protein
MFSITGFCVHILVHFFLFQLLTACCIFTTSVGVITPSCLYQTGLTFVCFIVQLSLKTEREKKREKYFPMRKYAIKA